MFGDLHIHMILDGVYYRAAIDAQKEHPLDGLVRARLSDYQARGVCLLRDGGDAWGVSLRARELAGEYGIDYRSPAFPIYRRGHYGAFIGRGFDTEDEYRALLDEAGEKRADFIKLMISGLIDFDHFGVLTEPGPEPQDIRRMIELAHAAGFAVMAHANGDRAVTAAGGRPLCRRARRPHRPRQRCRGVACDARAGHFGRARLSHCGARPTHGAASAGGRSVRFCYILPKVTVDLPKFLRYNN